MGFKIKGGLAGSADRIKKDQERKSEGRSYIRRVKDGEALKVRFLTEPEGWFQFREYYVQGVGYFPDANLDELGINLPTGTRSPSKRYLANTLLVGENRVVPLLLPLDLASRVVMRHDRNGTITDRDFILHRAGSGIDTKYDAETDDKSAMDLTQYNLVDLGTVLQRQFEDAFDLELDAEEEEGTVSSEMPFKEEASSTEQGGDMLTEDQAREMDRIELEAIADQIGITRTGNEDRDTLIESIFA